MVSLEGSTVRLSFRLACASVSHLQQGRAVAYGEEGSGSGILNQVSRTGLTRQRAHHFDSTETSALTVLRDDPVSTRLCHLAPAVTAVTAVTRRKANVPEDEDG
ncbi:hypothetical protein MTO96_003466 [Rhipicephalus appendiculatus]